MSHHHSLSHLWLLPLMAAMLACAPTRPAHESPAPAADTLAAEPVAPVKPHRTYPYDFVAVHELIPDAVLDIRYFGTDNFVGTRIDGYLAPVALLSREAANSLRAAADDLRREGYRLKIFDAYRPQKAVDHFMRWVADGADTLMRSRYYPMVPKSRMVGTYIARRSAHTRGAAVDLTLVDAEGRELDMGGTFDWFGRESRPTFCGDPERGIYRPEEGGLTEEQFRHRLLLRRAMLAHGFRAIKSEWWHFSLIREPHPRTYFNFDVE